MGVSIAVLALLAILAVYTGTIEAAFSALMRLSLRLTAERGRAGGLGQLVIVERLKIILARLDRR